MSIFTKIFILVFMVFSVSLIGQESVQLRWNASTDNVGVTGYNIWLDAVYYGTTSDTTFILNLDPGTYALSVSAFDAAGNESEKSMTLMLDVGDNMSPTIPDSLMLVYPNPTYGDFRLAIYREFKDPMLLQILSPNGQLIYERDLMWEGDRHIEPFQLTELLEEGIYIIALIENHVRIGHTYVMIQNTPKQQTAYVKNNINYETLK